jgi:hypothetical protein
MGQAKRKQVSPFSLPLALSNLRKTQKQQLGYTVSYLPNNTYSNGSIIKNAIYYYDQNNLKGEYISKEKGGDNFKPLNVLYSSVNYSTYLLGMPYRVFDGYVFYSIYKRSYSCIRSAR